MNKKNEHTGNHARAVLLGLAVAIAIFLVHLPFTFDATLYDDAADYMRAAQAPIAQTWLNTNSASPLEMLHLRHSNPDFKQRPWDYLYLQNDNAALRHFHGPVAFYAMHLASRIGSTHSAERVLLNLISAAACGLLAAFLLLNGCHPFLAILFALFAGLDNRFTETSIDPTCHAPYILCTLAFLLFFTRALTAASRNALYTAAALLALCIATLEFSIFLVASIVTTLVLLRLFARHSLPQWTRSTLLRAFAIFLATSFILWPGGWLRGGYLESYGVLSASVLLHNKSAFGEPLTLSLLDRALFAHHAVLLFLALSWIGGLVYLALKKLLPIPLLAVSVYTAFAFILGLADHFKLNPYISEFTVFLVLATGLTWTALLALVPSSQRAFTAVATLLLLLGVADAWPQRAALWATRPWLRSDFAMVRTHVPAGSTLLVSHDREAFSLYMPQFRFEPTLSTTATEPRSIARASDLHYGIFDSPLPLPSTATPVATVPTSPYHHDTLWQRP